MAVIDGILGDEARAIQFPVLPADQPQRIKASKEQVVDHTPEKKIPKLKNTNTTKKTPTRISLRIMMRFCVLANLWYRIKGYYPECWYE